MEIAPKWLTFSSLNSSPKDSFFVNGNWAQWTCFLFVKLKPRGLGFCSAMSPKIQTRADHLHSHTPHNRSLTLHSGPQLSLKPRTAPLRVSNPHRSSLSLKPCAHTTLSLKPTPSSQQITHTQTHTSPHSLSLFKPRANWPRHSSNPHSHSNLAPRHCSTSSLFKPCTTTQPQSEGRYPFSICLLWLDLNNFFIYTPDVFLFSEFALDTSYIISYLFFFYGGHTLISRTTPSWLKYLLIWKSSLFNDNVTTNYYFLWHPISIWGVKNIVKKMKKDFECFYKLNKQHSWFVRALL